MSITDNSHIVSGVMDAFARGDLEHVMSCMDEDVAVHSPAGLPYGGEYHGHDGLQRYMGAMIDSYDVAQEEYAARACGEQVVLRIALTFTARATGRSLNTSAIELYSFRDDRISDIDVFYKDTRAVADLLAT